jgi:arylsulfatase A-like enzyme
MLDLNIGAQENLLPQMMNRTHQAAGRGMLRFSLSALLLLLTAVLSCNQPEDPRPNVLWIVWDTVRADHLSLHGHERETTPFLDEWSREARVYDNCLSTAGYTMPSHAAMFTGLMPSETCADNARKTLDDRYTTIAELLTGAGYRSYLYSANPNVSALRNLAQGFETAQHPWDPQFADKALALVRGKLPEYDQSSELSKRLDDAEHGAGGMTPWNIKASGELAQDATLAWLQNSDSKKPYFVFLNYMEAHRPYIPPRRFREILMDPEEVDLSYEVDRSWLTMWEYTFGLHDYTDVEMELTQATYDAAILELDAMLQELLEALRREGHLDNTVVVLTSDHGEHLGEQHMLDHQYSVYQPLLRVPLIVHYPERFAPGHDDHPVMNFDLFPTLLALAGIEEPVGLQSRAKSLFDAAAERERVAEDPAYSPLGIRLVSQKKPDWDPSPWRRLQRAMIDDNDKFIWGSDGRHGLFDLAADPLETRNLVEEKPGRAAELQQALGEYHRSLQLCGNTPAPVEDLTPEQRELLKSIGYTD